MSKKLKEIILEKIKSGKTKKLPKAFFILKTLAFTLGLILITLISTFLTSFIVFSTKASGAFQLARFGAPGLKSLFLALPWFLFLIILLLIFSLWSLINHFPFSYRKPLTYSLLGVLIVVFLASAFILKTSIHEKFSNQAFRNHLPIAGHLYRRYQTSKNLYKGIVIKINDSEILIEDANGEKIKILISEKTRLPLNKKVLFGDFVVIGGEKNNDTITAFGIGKPKSAPRFMK